MPAKSYGAIKAPQAVASQNNDKANPQFSLRSLLIAVSVFGVLLPLFQTLGTWGALLAFLFALAVTKISLERAIAGRASPKSCFAIYDLIWGVFMPIVCFTFDPVFFKNHGSLRLGPTTFWQSTELYFYSLPMYMIVGLQVVAMSIWLLFGRVKGRYIGLLAGVLSFGCRLSVSVGVLLFVPSVLAIGFFGIGLMGLTPWLTAFAFYRASRRASFRARWTLSPRFWRVSYAAGFVGAVIIPTVLGVVASKVLTPMIVSLF